MTNSELKEMLKQTASQYAELHYKTIDTALEITKKTIIAQIDRDINALFVSVFNKIKQEEKKEPECPGEVKE